MEDYCKILIALENAVATSDKQTEEYKDRIRAYETLTSDRAERLLGAKMRTAQQRQRKTENKSLRSITPISPRRLFQDMSPSQQEDAYETLQNQVSVLSFMLKGSSESAAFRQYMIDDENKEYRHAVMTSKVLSNIAECEASESLVLEHEAGQHCPTHTENADEKYTEVAAEKKDNHVSNGHLRRMLSRPSLINIGHLPRLTRHFLVCTSSLFTRHCTPSMVTFVVSKNVVCVCESSTLQFAIY